MPANTVNRGYPYSIPTDPADVAQAIEDLATAIDADLVTIGPSIVARRMARVSRSAPISFGTTGTSRTIEWDTIEFNIRGAVATFPGAPADRIIPAFPGFWVATGQVSYTPVTQISTPVDWVDADLRRNGFRLGRQSDTRPINPIGGSQSRTLNVAMGMSFNGTTDYWHMNASIIRSSGVPNANYSMFGASMTIWQMTQS